MKIPSLFVGTPPTSPTRTVTGAVTTTIACVLPVFLVGGLAVQVGAELRFDPAGLGIAVSSYFAVSALASVPSGALVERLGPVATARAGIILAALALGGIAGFARSYAALLVMLSVAGVGNALGQLASNAALAAHIPRRRQGFSFGVKQAAIPASTLLAGLAVPGIALTVGWRWAFALAALLAIGALPLVPPDGRGTVARTGARARVHPGDAVRLAVVGLAATLAGGAANALGTFLVDAAVAGGVAPGLAGLALTAGGTLCLILRLVGGALADHLTGGHIGLIAVAMVGGAGGLALLAGSSTGTLVVGVLLGFGLGWSWPGLMNFAVVRLHPQAPAAATSITQTGVYVGGCVGPLAFGATAAGFGYPTAWLGAAVAMLAGAMLMLLGQHLLRHHRPAHPPS